MVYSRRLTLPVPSSGPDRWVRRTEKSFLDRPIDQSHSARDLLDRDRPMVLSMALSPNEEKLLVCTNQDYLYEIILGHVVIVTRERERGEETVEFGYSRTTTTINRVLPVCQCTTHIMDPSLLALCRLVSRCCSLLALTDA